jgi:hypothetical protein
MISVSTGERKTGCQMRIGNTKLKRFISSNRGIKIAFTSDSWSALFRFTLRELLAYKEERRHGKGTGMAC